MLRSIAGVVLGYLSSVAVVFGLMTAGWMVLGSSGSFKDGSWDVTPVWIGVWLGSGIGAALIAGLVVGVVSRRCGAVLSLAGLMLILGLGMGIASMLMPEEEKPARTDDVTMWDAMNNAEQPIWIMYATPVIGAIGVMIGGCAVTKRKCSSNADES